MKRFDLVIDAALEARLRCPSLTLTIVGDGPERAALERRIAAADATGWITMAGRIDRDDLVEHYQRSWLVVSGSLAEGWGLSLTEAAACGTAAVATDISGHRSSVVADVTGVLATDERLGQVIGDVVTDPARRVGLERAALARAATLTWDASALGVTRCLHAEVVRSQGERG